MKTNTRLRMEFPAVHSDDGTVRELRVFDETSGLLVAEIRLDAGQFAEAMSGSSFTAAGWLSPPEVRARLGRAVRRTHLHVDRFTTTPAQLEEWAARAARTHDAIDVDVDTTNVSLRATWVFDAGDADGGSTVEPVDVEAITAALTREAVAAGFTLAQRA